MVEMTVYGLTQDNDQEMVWLRSVEDDVMVPIVIGTTEAMSIYAELYDEETQRPLTHDLLRNILDHFEAEVVEVNIVDLKESIFYAELIISAGGTSFRLDARPSDSIALALKFKAPVFISDKVLKRAGYKVKMMEDESLFEQIGPLRSPDATGGELPADDVDVALAVNHLLEETGLSKASRSAQTSTKVAEQQEDNRIQELREQMREAVKKERYEEACELRDQIERLEQDS